MCVYFFCLDYIQYNDRINPLGKHLDTMAEMFPLESSSVPCQFIGNAGREHMQKYGTLGLIMDTTLSSFIRFIHGKVSKPGLVGFSKSILYLKLLCTLNPRKEAHPYIRPSAHFPETLMCALDFPGSTREQFAKIAWKNHSHSKHNP